MEEKKLVPKLRFPGFTEPWEQRELGEITERYDNLRVPITASLRIPGNTPYYGANGIQDYVEGHTHEGEFVLVAEDGANDLKNYPVQFVNGRIWVNNHAHVLQGKKDIIYNHFLAYAIKRTDMGSLLVGGSRSKLNAETLMKIAISVPEIEEQRVVGTQLNQFDNLITLHQRKLEHLKLKKKSLLQKLFPKEGEVYPELRFPGFTDPWEQRKLKHVVELRGRIGFRGYTEKDIISKEQGGLLTFSPTNIIDDQITFNCKNTYITKTKYDESPEIKIINGDILFVKTGSTLGKSALVTELLEDATINPQIVLMRPNELNPEFLANMMITNDIMVQVRRSKIGGAVPTLTETNIKEFDIFIPTEKDESNRIGNIFKNINQLITLHQRKLEHLQLLKKALLQQLFV